MMTWRPSHHEADAQQPKGQEMEGSKMYRLAMPLEVPNWPRGCHDETTTDPHGGVEDVSFGPTNCNFAAISKCNLSTATWQRDQLRQRVLCPERPDPIVAAFSAQLATWPRHDEGPSRGKYYLESLETTTDPPLEALGPSNSL